MTRPTLRWLLIAVCLIMILIPTAATGQPRKPVALTFDDGPSEYTNNVLRILRHHQAHGTFYVQGSLVDGYRTVLRHAVRDGHEIANHTWDHPELTSLSDKEVQKQLGKTNRAIKDVIGEPPQVFRPPFGATNKRIARIARGRHLWSALWDVDPRDWETPGCDEIADRVLDAVDPGETVLMHDGGGDRSQSVCALKKILRELDQRDYRFVTQSRLRKLGDRPPTQLRSTLPRRSYHW